MQALEMVWQYDWARDALLGSFVIALLCSVLSVIVVLKRMAFIGQGISHGAFGGVGTASLLGLAGTSREIVVLIFCLMVAGLIAMLSGRRRMEQDTAIGILLVVAMAWGAIAEKLSYDLSRVAWYRQLIGPRQSVAGFEEILFGSIITLSTTWLVTASLVTIGVLGVMLLWRRQILYFTFDEESSRVGGVPATLVHLLLLGLMTLAVVLTMRLAGVILTSALLVLPGVTALTLSRRLVPVVVLSVATGVVGCTLGLLMSLNWATLPPGPCMVLVLTALYACAHIGHRIRCGVRS